MTFVPPLEMIAGTYTGEGGRGVYTVRRDAHDRWSLGDVYPGAVNASFAVHSRRHGLHYIVDERDTGAVGVYRHDAEGWAMLAGIATRGSAPCHVALDRQETRLAVANYASGSVSLLRLDPRDGLPDGTVQVHANMGSGPNPERQEGPHAHWVGFSPDGCWLYQTDLGADRILAHAIDAHGTLGAARTAYAAPAGSGPRHLLLHPMLENVAYLLSELSNTLTVLVRSDGEFHCRHVLTTLPQDWQGSSIAAHIAIDRAGDRLYVSNRGHDSIAVFAVDADGMPHAIQHAAAGGASPRFFLIHDAARLMIVANERSQTLTTLAMEDDGRLRPTGVSLPVPGIAFVMTPHPVR